ncbi:MAG: HD domain-containing protein [Patescibacteria group bacterium]
MQNLSEFVQAFALRIANEPQTGSQVPRVFYVGGTVRDRVRGIEAYDVDVEVYGVAATRVQELLEEIAGESVDAFGVAFGVYKISCADGVVDVALPRSESKKGKGHKGFSITGDPHLSFEDALRRRDFTMNAMLADVLTGEIIDPYHGKDDIVHGLLRVVDERTFVEDPLRIYRGMQFVARFDFAVEEKSMKLFCEMAQSPELDTLSLERVTEEWRKMLRSEHPEKGLRFLEETGLLARYPELYVLCTTEQDSRWHPEGSVWEHVILSCRTPILSGKPVGVNRHPAHQERWIPGQARNDEGEFDLVTYRLALLLHDVGKGVVTKKIGKKISDEGHADAGIEITKRFFNRFTFGDDCEKDVLVCVKFHEVLPELYRKAHAGDFTEAQSANALRILWRDVGVDRVPLFLAVCEANARGRDLPLDDRPYPVRVWAEELSHRYGLFAAAAEPLLSGADVQNIALRLACPIPQGKKFGMLLADIELARDRGEIVTRNDAIGYLEALFVSVIPNVREGSTPPTVISRIHKGDPSWRRDDT